MQSHHQKNMPPVSRRDFLGRGALFLGGFAGFKPFGKECRFFRDEETDCKPTQDNEKRIDMTQYLVPWQKADDERQFHLTGYSRCLGGNWCGPNDMAYSEGGFMKVVRVAPNEHGEDRFVLMKATQRGKGVPCEYFVVREEVGDKGSFKRIYLETETMDWGGNKESRNYHDRFGNPTFEWGSSEAFTRSLNIQNPPNCHWNYCGTEPDEDEPIPLAAGYTVHGPFDLESSIASIERELGSIGTVDPRTADIVYALGLKKPKMFIITGYWGPINDRILISESNSWNRERYDYLAGEEDVLVEGKLTTALRSVQLVGWHAQGHKYNDPREEFETQKEGVLTKLVWEDTPILPLMPCEDVPAQSSSLRLRRTTLEEPLLLLPPRFGYRTLTGQSR